MSGVKDQLYFALGKTYIRLACYGLPITYKFDSILAYHLAFVTARIQSGQDSIPRRGRWLAIRAASIFWLVRKGTPGQRQQAEIQLEWVPEKAWGGGGSWTHVDAFDTVNNLDLLYSDQGKMKKKAEDMYLRTLAGKEKGLMGSWTHVDAAWHDQ